MFVHELILRGKRDDLAILDQGRRITYRQLQNATAVCRDRLYAAGVRAHDTVGIFSRNNAEYIYTYMAIASLGAIAVPINFQLSRREIAYILKDADIHYLLTYKPLALEEALQAQHYTGSLQQFDIVTFHQEPARTPAPLLPADFSEDEPCVIIYTSGTTGAPKGAVLTHKNLVKNAAQVQIGLDIKASDNVICVLPMYHCFGWTCSVLNPLYCGSCITILDSFAPKETIDVIRKEQISILYVVPSICSLLTKLAKKEDLASVRLIILGGTTLPIKIAEDFMAKFGLSITEGYGLSEASPVVTLNPPGQEKIGSIGLPLQDIEARIVDSAGQDMPIGEAGELIIRSDTVMQGYWKLPDATAEALQDGWLHTSDVARQDEDGYIYIVDRLKDMIISMGENIYPREIEELIYHFPGIYEAAVIGIDDKLRGQAGACFYSVQDGARVNIRELKKFLQQNLALYKIPREFHELDELAKTTTGKIAKREILKDFYASKPVRK